MLSEMIQGNEYATWLAIRIARRLILVDECIAENVGIGDARENRR